LSVRSFRLAMTAKTKPGICSSFNGISPTYIHQEGRGKKRRSDSAWKKR
jgi:hypothetical protein